MNISSFTKCSIQCICYYLTVAAVKTKSVFPSGVATLTIQITKEGLFKEAIIIKICCRFCLLFVFAAAGFGVGVDGGCGAVVAIYIDFVVVPQGVSYSNDVYELLLSFPFIQIKCLYTFFLLALIYAHLF